MKAYLICEENLPEIKNLNEGVGVAFEWKATYFIFDSPDGYNQIVNESQFNTRFRITKILDGRKGRFEVERF
jgi:hypothetical protein